MITTQADVQRQHATSNAPADRPPERAPLPPLSDRDTRKLNDYLFVHEGDLTATARAWGCLEVGVISYLEHPLIALYLAALARLKRDADCRAALDTLRDTLAAPELTPAHAERRRAAAAILRHHRERAPRTPRAARQQHAPANPPANPPESQSRVNPANRSTGNPAHDNTGASSANTARTTNASPQSNAAAAKAPAQHNTGASSFAAQSGDT